jgi:hypothetical protein
MKDEKKKILNKIIIRIFIILLIIYSVIYFGEGIGYLEYEQYKKTILTEEKIEQFEQDVKDGKEIDINSYMDLEEMDYSSSISNFGYHLSNEVEKIVTSSMNSIFKFLNDMNSE